MYDLIIGGAGLFGATLANYAKQQGKKVLVIERGPIGGMCAGGNYSKYGIHVFHTSNRWLWEYVNGLTHFKPVHYSPLALYNGEYYSFPVNLLTLKQLGIDTLPMNKVGRNYEEIMLNMVGTEIYIKFFYHYTRKMWGREPSELPISLAKRVPIRLDYNTSYYTDTYIGVPEQGYDALFESLLDGVEVVQDDFMKCHYKYDCKKVFTGSIDELHGWKYGPLEYRGMRFTVSEIESKAMATNYTDWRSAVRKIDYSYLWDGPVIIETPDEGQYYPVPWGRELYEKYAALPTDVICAGRLGSYRYLNMNEVMEQAIELFWEIC